jgi:acetyl-CoA C-acetyltransferase
VHCIDSSSTMLCGARLLLSAPTRRRRDSRSFASGAKFSRDQAPVIVSAVRTPIGSFQGALSSLTAPQLGGIVIKEAVSRAKLQPDHVDEVIMGNVVSAGVGQAPARQAAIAAGLPWTVIETTVNKVCSSGMKAAMFAAQEILTGQYQSVVAGGFESMSNVPYYLPKARKGFGYGNAEVIDGVLKDGLWDVYTDQHMGNCAEICASTHSFSRQDQDKYALESYRRAQQAIKDGWFKDEIVAVQVTTKKGQETVSEDEEPKNLKPEKVSTVRAAFKKDGTVTAVSSSKINDGAAALLIAHPQWAKERGLKPLARILGFADAAKSSVEFTTAPALAIPRAIANAGLSAKDVDYYEINEAFAVVSLANIKLLGLDPSKVNAHGGAVALGHPIGASGARMLVTLLNVLKQNSKSIGAATICNGGGGASAVILERLQ